MTKKAQQKKTQKTTAKSTKNPKAAVKKTTAPKAKKVRKHKAKSSVKKVAAKTTVKKKTAAKKPSRKTARKRVSTTSKTPNFQEMEAIMSKGKNQFKQFEQIAQDATDFSREGFEAFQKSMGILAQRSEEIWKTAMGITQSSAEKQQKLLKAAMSSKTLNEWADNQNKIAQSQFDDFVSVTTTISEMSVKALTESAEPINQQVTKVVSKATQQSKAA